MIDSLRGEIAERGLYHVVVDCHGVGYRVSVTPETLTLLPEKGVGRLYTHYSVTIDVRSGSSEQRLFGFASDMERQLFRQLIAVQGVSSSIGMAIMGGAPADDIRRAILLGDETLLKRIKGIGPKLAQRIVGELQGRLLQQDDITTIGTPSAATGNTVRNEALSALLGLGLDRLKAEKALQAVLKERNDAPTVEELIKLSLKNL